MASNQEAVELQRTLNTIGWRYIMKIAADICEDIAVTAIECEGTDEQRLTLQKQAQAARKFLEKFQATINIAAQVPGGAGNSSSVCM